MISAGLYYFFLYYRASDWFTVKAEPLIEAVYGLGTVKADQEYQLASGVLAAVDKLYVKEGAIVKKGDPLVKLTLQPLFIAPFGGTITALPINEHEVVHPNDELLTLTNLQQRYLLVSMEQRDMVKVRLNQKVDISFESLRDQKYQGKVEKIYPSQGDFNLKISLPEDLPESVLPGMTADVAVEVGHEDKAIVVPIEAVVDDAVKVKSNGRIKTIKVKTKALDEERTEILSDEIKAGDRLMLQKSREK